MSITAIINIFRRGNTLEEQIEAIKEQNKMIINLQK
jgi:hypothetical protein